MVTLWCNIRISLYGMWRQQNFVPKYTSRYVNPVLNSSLSIHELYQEICKQPNINATGNDGVAFEALEQSFQFMANFLLRLMNTNWNTDAIPVE